MKRLRQRLRLVYCHGLKCFILYFIPRWHLFKCICNQTESNQKVTKYNQQCIEQIWNYFICYRSHHVIVDTSFVSPLDKICYPLIHKPLSLLPSPLKAMVLDCEFWLKLKVFDICRLKTIHRRTHKHINSGAWRTRRIGAVFEKLRY